MTDQSVELEQIGAAEAAQAPQIADDQLIAMLVDRARSEGLQLTGEGGLLQQLTKAFPEAYASGQLKAYHVPGNGMSGMSSWLQ